MEACSKMAQCEDLFSSSSTERPLMQELFTFRYEDLDTGFNEKDYATASKEGESIENLQLSETHAYEINLEWKRGALFNSHTGHMGNLRKIHNRLIDLMKEDGAPEDVLNGCHQFL